jgi:hypothetical protein
VDGSADSVDSTYGISQNTIARIPLQFEQRKADNWTFRDCPPECLQRIQDIVHNQDNIQRAVRDAVRASAEPMDDHDLRTVLEVFNDKSYVTLRSTSSGCFHLPWEIRFLERERLPAMRWDAHFARLLGLCLPRDFTNREWLLGRCWHFELFDHLRRREAKQGVPE